MFFTTSARRKVPAQRSRMTKRDSWRRKGKLLEGHEWLILCQWLALLFWVTSAEEGSAKMTVQVRTPGDFYREKSSSRHEVTTGTTEKKERTYPGLR